MNELVVLGMDVEGERGEEGMRVLGREKGVGDVVEEVIELGDVMSVVREEDGRVGGEVEVSGIEGGDWVIEILEEVWEVWVVVEWLGEEGFVGIGGFGLGKWVECLKDRDDVGCGGLYVVVL